MERILYVEDDLSLIEGLKYTLEKNNFIVDSARTVREAKQYLDHEKYALLLLDVTLPDGTGFDICKEVRKTCTVPIIFLTASDEEINVVMGLDMGGDDYITKPFKLNELVSRVKALIRRSTQFSKNEIMLESNHIQLNTIKHQVKKNDIVLELTILEYKLLYLFMSNPGQTLSRNVILDKMWDSKGDFVDDNTLSVYIRRLRCKLEENPNEPKMLVTVRGFGYRWNIE